MLALIADRTVGNTLEQMGPFLVSTWLHAILVPGGPVRAAASAERRRNWKVGSAHVLFKPCLSMSVTQQTAFIGKCIASGSVDSTELP